MVQNATVDRVTAATVDYLDALRRDALRGGLSPLKQYDQIQSRVVLACSTAATTEEWATTVARRLQVQSPSSSTCSAMRELVEAVRETATEGRSVRRATSLWLRQIHREAGYVVALLRLRAETRRDDWAERREEEAMAEAASVAARAAWAAVDGGGK